MRIFAVLFFLTAIAVNAFSQRGVRIGAEPAWITKLPVKDVVVEKGNGSYQYLLIDEQIHLPGQTRFSHYAVKTLNAEGVQSMSDLSFDFDPSYQKMTFHRLQIIRANQTIDKLVPKEIKVYQRETNMERALYDGSLTAVINLTDVREGDIIEYSYSVTGFNPVKKGKYSTNFYQQYTTPVNRIHSRLLAHEDTPIEYRKFNEAPDPVIKRAERMVDYTWDVEALDYVLFDNNVPSWYDPYRRISLSTHGTWADVVQWALPLYELSPGSLNNIDSGHPQASGKEHRILDLIRMVQDDIRYLGFESGINAYQPHAPSQVFAQKFGDCKDKSLLLVGLLRREGVEAFPMLVNTTYGNILQEELPSSNLFDHCVVTFNYGEKQYFIDPTISNQGGGLDNIYFPYYGKGLVIKEGSEALIALPDKTRATMHINELITVHSIGGSADIIVRTEYTGSRADRVRSYFEANSMDYVQKSYQDYYSSLYPTVKSTSPVKFYDYDRNSSNKVIVEEYYSVDEFWTDAADSSYKYLETYPLVLESLIEFAKTSERKMPYYLGEPVVFSQKTKVDMPEPWIVEEYHKKIDGKGFTYENHITGNGKTVSVEHHFNLHARHVSADSASFILAKNSEVKKELSFYLKYTPQIAGFRLSWISIVISIFAVLAGGLFAYRLYKNYNPEPWQFAENKPIGSWLILPAIGLSISPFVLLATIIQNDQFNQSMWEGAMALGDDKKLQVALFVASELVANILFLIYTVLLIFLFFQRRTSVPRLISIYYAVGFLLPAVDIFIASTLLPQLAETTSSDINDISRAIIAAAIWVPYFNVSERAKSTFCKKVDAT